MEEQVQQQPQDELQDLKDELRFLAMKIQKLEDQPSLKGDRGDKGERGERGYPGPRGPQGPIDVCVTHSVKAAKEQMDQNIKDAVARASSYATSARQNSAAANEQLRNEFDKLVRSAVTQKLKESEDYLVALVIRTLAEYRVCDKSGELIKYD